MRKQYHLILLENHPPSDAVSVEAEAMASSISEITMSKTVVNSSLSLKQSKREYKYANLPCLLDTTDDRKSRWTKFYGSDILGELEMGWRKGVEDERS